MKDKLMEREMLGGIVRQRINDQMLCLSDLGVIYESQRINNGWISKRISEFFTNKTDAEYIIELLELQGVFIKTEISVFMDIVENKGLLFALKSIGQYVVTGRGLNKSTFCNPYIFVAVAQWLNPKFRAQVTMWVTDSLILNRIEAGAQFNELCTAINDYILPTLSDNGKKFIYSNFAKLINIHVFGRHDSELRQIANKDQLLKLSRIESKIAALIEVGHITDYHGAKEYLSK